MKKLLSVVAVLSLAPFIFTAPVSALATCDIGYTGPDSNNQCTSQTQYVCTVDTTNHIDIKNENNQVVVSGGVISGGSTQAGGATSGQVTNANGTVFDVTIINSEVAIDTCIATETIPAKETPATPVTQVSSVTPVQPQATGAGAAAALPYTSGDNFSSMLLTAISSLGALAAISYVSALVYRRVKLS